MKVGTSILILLFTITFKTHAQILIGPVIGPQVSWVSFDDKDNAKLYKQKPVFGFHAGADLSFRVNKRFFLHTAFLYSMKGKWLEGKEDALLSNKARYHFIDIPLAYTAEFISNAGTGKQFKWYLGLGPNVSYLLKGKGTLRTSTLNEILIDKIDYELVFDKDEGNADDNDMIVREANRLQLGINLSSGLVFEPIRYQKVMVTFRYEFGHSFYSREGTGVVTRATDYVDDLKVKNQGFRLSFAYLIDLKLEDRKKGKSTIKKKNMK